MRMRTFPTAEYSVACRLVFSLVRAERYSFVEIPDRLFDDDDTVIQRLRGRNCEVITHASRTGQQVWL